MQQGSLSIQNNWPFPTYKGVQLPKPVWPKPEKPVYPEAPF